MAVCLAALAELVEPLIEDDRVFPRPADDDVLHAVVRKAVIVVAAEDPVGVASFEQSERVRGLVWYGERTCPHGPPNGYLAALLGGLLFLAL